MYAPITPISVDVLPYICMLFCLMQDSALLIRVYVVLLSYLAPTLTEEV
jgi:hypothetical protein